MTAELAGGVRVVVGGASGGGIDTSSMTMSGEERGEAR